jgi:hypothetical protein
MTKIGLFEETVGADELPFRAIAAHGQAMGRTAGGAIDALTAQLPTEAADTLIIVRGLHPDRYFTESQRQRLSQLVASWRAARDLGGSLTAAEQSELENLIDAEIRAAGERAKALRLELGS